MFIVDCTPWAEEVEELAEFRRVFVNPEIYERSGRLTSLRRVVSLYQAYMRMYLVP